ncbi:MAG: hypothetical protein ACOYMN_10010 [Roseimicrobium sp.]
MASTAKKISRKTEWGTAWSDHQWSVKYGKLVPSRGYPGKIKSLFKWVGEKIPFEGLPKVRAVLNHEGADPNGVYMAHDSMGFARYVGRGHVFNRLQARKRAYPNELVYFSFYLIADKKHEREVETLLIRLGGAHLQFNDRKKRIDISPGNIRDYEAGTHYVERQGKKGKAQKA